MAAEKTSKPSACFGASTRDYGGGGIDGLADGIEAG
jgi:hypothetical protein